MKRIVSAVLVTVFLALAFSACGEEKGENRFSEALSSSVDSFVEENNGETEETSEETMPIVYINVENGEGIPDNKESVDCSIDLENSGKKYFVSGLFAKVRTRGNGSLTVAQSYGKYPYKIKFDKKTNPFDMDSDPNRDWVLIPNRGDRTMLRNFAAKRLGKMLGGIPVSPEFLAVHVYLNGKYEGVYELTEQIEVAKGRVPVDDSLKGAENGFLIELDRYARDPEEGDVTFGVGKNLYTVKSDVKSEKQLAFIEDYVGRVEDAIYRGNEEAFLELADINSAVDMYLLQEFSKNIDAGFSSFYMYRNAGGKLYFAPPWDFDLAFGNDVRLDEGSSKGLYIATGREGFSQNHLWYMELCKNDWFIKRVKTRWAEISDREISKLISEVEKKAELLSEDMEANFRRWPEFDTKLHQEPEHTLEFTTYKEHTDYLIGWMKERKAFLDSIYG